MPLIVGMTMKHSSTKPAAANQYGRRLTVFSYWPSHSRMSQIGGCGAPETIPWTADTGRPV